MDLPMTCPTVSSAGLQAPQDLTVHLTKRGLTLVVQVLWEIDTETGLRVSKETPVKDKGVGHRSWGEASDHFMGLIPGKEWGMEEDWQGRVSDFRAALRKTCPGHGVVLEPQSPTGGVPRVLGLGLP